MKKIIIAIVLSLFPVTAYADSVDRMCESHAVLVDKVYGWRSMGVPIGEALRMVSHRDIDYHLDAIPRETLNSLLDDIATAVVIDVYSINGLTLSEVLRYTTALCYEAWGR